MASTNKTANLRLNQWQLSDFVSMEDFNADNAAIDAAVTARLKIQSGSYVGTGVYGSNVNKSTLSFDFAPKAVILYTSEVNTIILAGQTHAYLCQGYEYQYLSGETMYTYGSDTHGRNALVWSADGKTLSWYGLNITSAQYQYNQNGVTYNWMAIA